MEIQSIYLNNTQNAHIQLWKIQTNNLQNLTKIYSQDQMSKDNKMY